MVLLYLCPKPNEEQNPTEKFKKAQKLYYVIKHLFVCVEGPAQLVFKIFLIFNGMIERDTFGISVRNMEDTYGNVISCPTISAIQMFISLISLMKTIYDSIIFTGKPNDSSCFKVANKICHVLPYVIVTILFKTGSLVLILTYYTTFATIPLVVHLMGSLYANDTMIKDQDIPKWIVPIASLFLPFCLALEKSKKVVETQWKNLLVQTILSIIVYEVALTIILVLVNNSSLFINPSICLSNQEFTLLFMTIILYGILSLLYSISLAFQRRIKIGKVAERILKICKVISVIIVLILPIIIKFSQNMSQKVAFVHFKNNSTKTIPIRILLEFEEQFEICGELNQNIVLVDETDWLQGRFNGSNKYTKAFIIRKEQKEIMPSFPYHYLLDKKIIKTPIFLIGNNTIDIESGSEIMLSTDYEMHYNSCLVQIKATSTRFTTTATRFINTTTTAIVTTISPYCKKYNNVNQLDMVGLTTLNGWKMTDIKNGVWEGQKSFHHFHRFCTSSSSWYGLDIHPLVNRFTVYTLETELHGCGKALLSYANCWNLGKLVVYLNNVAISEIQGRKEEHVTFFFKDNDILKLESVGAIINFKNILQCHECKGLPTGNPFIKWIVETFGKKNVPSD